MSGDRALLPNGWAWSTLGDLCQPPQYGWTTKAAGDGTTRFLRTTDITKGPIDWSTVPYCSDDPDDVEKYRLQPGDIVVSRAGSVGYSALIGDCPRAVFASYLIRFRPLEPAMAPYLIRYMQSPDYWKAIGAETVGIALANVNAKKLAALRVPVPPLEEQQVIVAAIDSSLGTIATGVRHFDDAATNLVKFEHACYRAAVRGELSPTDELGETSDELLHRLSVSSLASSFRRPEWPQHWAVAALGDLSARVTSGSRDWKPYYDRGTGIFVLTQSVRMRALDMAKSINVDPPRDDPARERSAVARDDLLITIVGANVGNTARVPDDLRDHFVCQSLALVRPRDPAMSQFLELYLTAPSGGQAYFESCFYGQGRPHISFPDIKRMPVPVPPLAEQASIVAAFDSLVSRTAVMRKTVAETQAHAATLRHSVLHHAFRGDLTPRIAGAEHAASLLDRVRAVRQTRSRKTRSPQQPRSESPAVRIAE
jgi:type I restriction enzyme S subunit